MSTATSSVLFNAVPLFAVTGAYVAVTAALLPTIWRERQRVSAADLTLAVLFPVVATVAAISGAVVVHDRRPVAGHLWLSFAAFLVALVPAFLFFTRLAQAGLVSDSERMRDAEARTTELDRELEAVTALSSSLLGAEGADAVARPLIDKACALMHAEFGALTMISDDQAEGVGLLARSRGEDVDWFRTVTFDLLHEPSGTASTVFDVAPLAIYDVQSSALVSRPIVDRIGAKSAAFVPLITEGRVRAVLVVASLDELRAFTNDELSLLQALCNEAALALGRLRSSSALGEALARERLVSHIAAKFRTELDLPSVLRVAVEETGRALGSSRCFVLIGERGSPLPVAAEWFVEGLDPIGEAASRLPVSNLAARENRTIAVADIEHEPALDDRTSGDVDSLRKIGTAAVLATPIVVFDELVGLFVLHRADAGPWSESEVAVAEAVAREAGLALHMARLLAENEQRLRQQTALLRAAEQITGELELDTVLQRLVDEVASLLGVDAADLYLLDTQRHVLRCAAVHGLPQELVGFEFPADRGVAAAAIRRGAPVVATDYGRVSDPVPHQAYEGFTAAIVAPVVWSGETRGVLGLGARTGRTFTEADVGVLGAFATLASLALRNAETYEERTRQAVVQRGFYRIASVLGRPLSLAEAIDAAAQAATEALDGAFAAVLMPSRDGGLELAGSYGLPSALAVALSEGVPPSASVLELCASERRMLATSALVDDDRFGEEWKELARSGDCGSLLAVPLETARGEGCGIVLVFFSGERSLVDDDLELARHLADVARGALERSELYESERSARALAQQLARTGSLLATELDPAAVLDEVVQRAPSLLGADACAIRVLEGDELVLTAASGEGASGLVGDRAASTGWLSGDVFQSRLPVAIANAADERYVESDAVLAAGYSAYLGVPLIGPEGTMHGVLSLYAARPRTWRAEEIEALLALAGNTSAALSNAELFTSVALDRERSYAILANIADGIVAVDRDGNVVLWNAAAERITGVPASEALGRTIAQTLQRDIASEDGEQAGRLVSIPRGSEDVWLSVTEAVMRDPTGSVAGRILAFRDISADRLVEEMKSEFVATVSHELRGPLTSIYGFAETLLREDVLFGDEERKTFIGYIASESERLTSIVDALLNVARLDTGDLQVNLAPTDVRAVVSEVVEGVEDAASNGHTFVLDLPEEPLAAQADRDKLRQILAALVDNAIKFSPDGGTVTVAARRTSDGVEVRVEDEGIGIPQAEQEWIFRKFYRGAVASSGTGLGLFIAQGLVSAMGGRILVDSEEGKGSRFSFELTVAPGSLAVEEHVPRV